MNERIELKPCPFCGGNAKLVDHTFWNDTTKSFSYKSYGVMCRHCGVQGFQFYETEEEAINAWNRRATDGKAD